MRKFKEFQENLSDKYKRSINCFNPNGFPQHVHYVERRQSEETKSKLKK
jgi:hypothetical protein